MPQIRDKSGKLLFVALAPSTPPPTSASGRASARRWWVFVCVVGFLLLLGVVGYQLVARRALATLTEERGEVERDFAAQVLKWQAASEGDAFHAGDGARTTDSDVAVFRLFTGARLTLRPASQIRFSRGEQTSTLGIQVDVGQADITTTEGGLTLASDFGPIVLEPNSSIAMSRRNDRLAVAVELGSIVFGNSSRRVAAGETLVLELGGIVLDRSLAEEGEPTQSEPSSDAVPERELQLGDGVARADLSVAPGESFTVHDPSPPTAVGIVVSQACGGEPARLSIGEQVTESAATAALALAPGRHDYEVRCLDSLEKLAASGKIVILQDAGTRALPSFAPSANVTTDGRRYTVMYQHRLPRVTISWPNAPQVEQYTLSIGARTITTRQPSTTLPSLGAGVHQVTFSAASEPPRKSRLTTIIVAYDTQAPTARVAMPAGGYDPAQPVQVVGQALPGWTVSLDGVELKMDGQRRFRTEVAAQDSLPITFSHPTRGTHYYLRRSKTSSP